MRLLGCTRLSHSEQQLQMASLDHAVWFLRHFRADEWLMYDQNSPSAGFGRGLAHCRIFDRAGHLVATVVQEGLMRFQLD
jgi:acyl-CoA thioesterase-2